jgi:hypothetical protein
VIPNKQTRSINIKADSLIITWVHFSFIDSSNNIKTDSLAVIHYSKSINSNNNINSNKMFLPF